MLAGCIIKKPEIQWINCEVYENEPGRLKELEQYDGVIIPGGFGSRGVEGKIAAIQYLRENKVPFFGLCYGLQLATIEFARNVCGISNATSTEIDPDGTDQVIHTMPDQIKKLQDKDYGSTMRLGAYPCDLVEGTVSFQAYGEKSISERHRHRYEVNNDYRDKLEYGGLKFAGLSPDNQLVEIIEVPNHPFFVGVQFHPEFKSRPLQGHPLFNAFIKACLTKEKKSIESVNKKINIDVY